jgi:hypothetical protein
MAISAKLATTIKNAFVAAKIHSNHKQVKNSNQLDKYNGKETKV